MDSNTPRRVTVFKNGCPKYGKMVLVPDTIEELCFCAGQKLGMSDCRLYTNKGVPIDDIQLVRDEDVIYVSSGECFTDSSEDWITLNVGGRHFTTTRATLVASDPESMLAKMFSSQKSWKSARDETGAYLIDRSPDYFAPLLNYLRHGKLILNEGINPTGVLEEAKFFGLTGVAEQLEEIIKDHDKDDDKPLTRQEFVRILLSTPSNCELRCQGINLEGADLSRLDLRYINFKMANLRRADLAGANLSNCCFERSCLSGAHMDGASLSGVRMQRANLEGASLMACNFEDPTGVKSANLEGVNMKSCDLEASQMSGVNLRVATMKGANLQNCNLRGAILAGADLENCNMSGCDLQDANVRGANIVGLSLEEMQSPLHMSLWVHTQSGRNEHGSHLDVNLDNPIRIDPGIP